MTDALIGYTGFVGSNLARQHPFGALYNTANIDDIAGRDFDLLVCSAAPAEKWKANLDPEADLASIRRLVASLDSTGARKLILISTVDVYPEPVGVDESSLIDAASNHAYGRHRKLLEDTLRERYDTLIVRLPGLFGNGLKKNAVYDLLHDNQLENIDARGVFQFYGLDNLWSDIRVALEGGLALVNIATEPVSVAEVAREAFGRRFDNRLDRPPARYDMRSRHADLYGGVAGYLQDSDRVLAELGAWVGRNRP